MKLPTITIPLPILVAACEANGSGLYDFLTDLHDAADAMPTSEDEDVVGQRAEVLVVAEGLLAIIDDTNEDNDDTQDDRFAKFLASRG